MKPPIDYNRAKAHLDASRCSSEVLTLDLDHIPPHTDKALTDDESKDPTTLYNQLSYDATNFGWLFAINEAQALIKLPGHPELEILIDLAHHTGYSFMLLTNGGPTAPKALGLFLS